MKPSQPGPVSLDRDPTDRSGDRLLARLGLLEDAPPLFGSGTAIPCAGVLLALPALIASGIFDCAKTIYGSLGPAFFGLRTTLLTLLSRRDLSSGQVAYWMFNRWRQENVFKYPRQEYALDALAEYAVEPDNPAVRYDSPAALSGHGLFDDSGG